MQQFASRRAKSSISGGCPFRKFHPAWGSRRKAESSHDWDRCWQSCTRSECSNPPRSGTVLRSQTMTVSCMHVVTVQLPSSMPTALIQINDGLKPCSPMIGARPRPATDRPRPRSGAAVEGQADPASDISSTPRPVGLVGCLMARRYQDQYTWQASLPFGNCNTVTLVCRPVNRRRAISYRRASPLPAWIVLPA